MSQSEHQTRAVVIEKTFAHPPEKVWRALTQPALLTQWLLRNDFLPEVGRSFQFRNEPVGGWDGVIECTVLALDPPHRLAYTWSTLGLASTVEFTLTATEHGTHVRMEHADFGADQDAAYQGATYGWRSFLARLEQLLQEVQ